MVKNSRPPQPCRLALLAALVMVAVMSAGTRSRASDGAPGATMLNDLRNLREMGSVLYIAAHPDDENTQLIAYLARGRHYRTGYLSLTRGDGGQNLLGPEFGAELGVIRTEELLAARHVDGGVQFFTRALDFGYSKDYQQTLTKWDRQEVVADMVRVIRTFRPDVLITRFSPLPTNTHGHHTASAVLALEAFKLAGDPSAFPDQLHSLTPWQPRRIFWNVTGQGGAPASATDAAANDIHIDISGTDALTGQSFAELAIRSRSMHKTQGFDNLPPANNGPRVETFRLLAGEPATHDLMDGIDTTWGRVPGGAAIGPLIDTAIAHFKPQDLDASLPALLNIRHLLIALSRANDARIDPVVAGKSLMLDRIIAQSIGLKVETTLSNAEIVPGQSITLTHTATIKASVPVMWLACHSLGGAPSPEGVLPKPIELQPNHQAERIQTIKVPLDMAVSQPYWLQRSASAGMFRVDEVELIGRPESPLVWPPVQDVFEVSGVGVVVSTAKHPDPGFWLDPQKLLIPDKPVQIVNAQTEETSRRRLQVVAPVSLGFASNVQLFTPSSHRTIQVTVTPAGSHEVGQLGLEVPTRWKVSPASQPFNLTSTPQTFAFTVTAPPHPQSVKLVASATIGGRRYSNERIDIRYGHIPPILLQPPATVKAVCLDLAIAGHKVGYLPGAGDSTAQSLVQMGYQVVPLTGADLTTSGLKTLDAVVIGVRAFNVRTDLAANLPALFAYIENGGTVVEQYNTPKGLQTPQLAPFSLTLSDNLPAHRVTDERSPVTLLAPNHPAFNVPNKIGPADFDGWVQERGLNFPAQWDTDHFTALLACNDVGEAPLTSGLLVAQYGKGYFVYTGLSFFRQLPAGVPGAYRLFANLVSLGKSNGSRQQTAISRQQTSRHSGSW